MKVLITGINGFIGKNLALSLENRYEIIGLSRDSVGKKKIQIIKHDITNKNFPDMEVDAIFHMAALTDLDFCTKNPKMAYEVNVKGTENVLEFAKETGVKKMVYASTGGVYGSHKKELIESMKPAPENEYSATKYKGELLCKKYSRFLSISVLRYFFPYGPFSDKKRLMPGLFDNINMGHPVMVSKCGGPMLNPIYISDAVSGTKKALEKATGFEVFNMAGKEVVSIMELAEKIGTISGKNVIFKFRENGKEVNFIGNMEKAKKILGYIPKVKLDEGLKKYAKHRCTNARP